MSHKSNSHSPKARCLIFAMLIFALCDSAMAQEHCKVRYQYNASGDRIKRDWYCWTQGHEIYVDDRAPDSTGRQLEEAHLLAMPNPASTTITVVVPEAGIGGTLELLSSSGARLRSTYAGSASNVWDITNLDAGLYLLRLTKGAEMVVTPVSIEH